MIKYCHSKSEVPTASHWAIIKFGQIVIPGDERSRSNPGHGYPEEIKNYVDYIAFTNVDEWSREVEHLSTLAFGDKEFVAMKVTPAIIRTKLTIEIE